ncbi:MAG TPA: class I SAM-dependent methyltransferase [Balneolales bacterium]|nr:class I SAM-dependent methyltransferase [Balneolales bacterium]
MSWKIIRGGNDMEAKKVICRSCGSEHLEHILSLGETPLADRLLTENQLMDPELTAPLDLVFCHDCTLTQITVSVSPDVLFRQDYPYFSSVSPSLLKHFADSSADIMKRKKTGRKSLVVEAASNDGYMLQNFQKKGIPVLGIDPAQGPAEAAIKKDIPTLCTFFTEELATQLRYVEERKADVFLANNVLAHVPDLNGFVEGIRIIMKDDGLAVIEVKYLVDLVEHCEFDTIYHQHLCYFSMIALDKLFRRHGLYINDVMKVSTQGGSLRIFVEKNENVKSSVKDLIAEELKAGVDTFGYYEHFAGRVKHIKESLYDLLSDLKKHNKRIAAYGAAAKGTTLMSYAGIDRNMIDYIVDLNTFKHGRFMCGNHIPIYPPSRLMEDQPDYVLLLAWNFKDEVMKQQHDYLKQGGHFIVPVPEVQMI